MKKIWKWLFGTQKNKLNTTNVINNITCGKPDKNGFADTYVNGMKTNVRILLFDKNEIEKLQKIIDENIHI